jgi:hypothetical protein
VQCIFGSPETSRLVPLSTQSLIQWVRGSLYHGGRWPGCAADRYAPASALYNSMVYTQTLLPCSIPWQTRNSLLFSVTWYAYKATWDNPRDHIQPPKWSKISIFWHGDEASCSCIPDSSAAVWEELFRWHPWWSHWWWLGIKWTCSIWWYVIYSYEILYGKCTRVVEWVSRCCGFQWQVTCWTTVKLRFDSHWG